MSAAVMQPGWQAVAVIADGPVTLPPHDVPAP